LEKVNKYLKETMAELRKMTWPTKDEIIGSTVVTVVVCLIVSLFIFGVDQGLTAVIKLVFGAGTAG
jgi:preprotein translocase subunit SecE